MSGLAFLNIGNLSLAVAPFGIEPTTKSGKDNSKFAGKNGHTPQGPVTKWQSSMEWGLDAKNRYEAPPKRPPITGWLSSEAVRRPRTPINATRPGKSAIYE